jgi:amino acid transporter
VSKSKKKQIGIFTLTSIGIGAIVGSGIFAMPAVMAAVAGPGLILGILLSGVISIFLALSYAELGASFPIEGGPYSFPRLSMGDLTGFLMGWGYFIYLFVGTAAIIDIFVIYLGFYVPGLAIGGTLTPLGITIAVVTIWFFTIINIYGVKWGSLYSIITTIGKMIPLLLFALIGFAYFHSSNFIPFLPFGFTGVTLAITMFFWSYTGFEAIVVPTSDIKKPARTIPWAMVLTILITIFVYLIIAIVFVGIIDWKAFNFAPGSWNKIGNLVSPLSDVTSIIGLTFLATIATVGAIISTGGSGGSWVLIQGRMPYAMAKDRLFWLPMAKDHPKYGTPANSLLLTSFLTSIVIISIPNFPSVALIASITAVLPYAAAVLSVPILRVTRKEVKRSFKLPIHYLFTVIGFILATFLIYWASWPWTLVGMILLLTGYPVFLLVKEKHVDWKRSLWVVVYLVGIVTVSFIGDTKFEYNNFTPWHPLGYLQMPYDLIVLTIFSILIYIWGFKVNTKKKYIIEIEGQVKTTKK